MRDFSQKDSEIVFCAFRYCMGRIGPTVFTFCKYAAANIRGIWTRHLEAMDLEITEADEKDKADSITGRFLSRLGITRDRANWLKLRDTIRAELKRRAEK